MANNKNLSTKFIEKSFQEKEVEAKTTALVCATKQLYDSRVVENPWEIIKVLLEYQGRMDPYACRDNYIAMLDALDIILADDTDVFPQVEDLDKKMEILSRQLF